MKILVVEDDPSIAAPLIEGLTRNHFDVTHVSSGRAALGAQDFDFVLLDLGLPDMDGLDVCRSLRAEGNVPIIVISARDDESDRVLALELGADDYLTKPFGIKELIARIRAVVRRLNTADTSALTIGDLVLNPRNHKVERAGVAIELTAKEFEILAQLIEGKGAVIKRDDLITAVWSQNWFGPTKTLDVHIASLRKKLGEPDLIQNVRGVGYRVQAAE